MEKKKKSMILARISALCWEEIIDWSLKTALPLPPLCLPGRGVSASHVPLPEGALGELMEP